MKTTRMPSFSKAVIGSNWGVLEGVDGLSRSANAPPVESDVLGALPPNRSARLVGFEAGICPIPPRRSAMACLPPVRHTSTGTQPTSAVQNQEQQDDGAIFLAALFLKGHTCARISMLTRAESCGSEHCSAIQNFRTDDALDETASINSELVSIRGE